jgi:hypothetical protein
MMNDKQLESLATGLGIAMLGLIVVYHFISNNTKAKEI